MLGKLLKHDYRATGWQTGFVALGLLAAAGLVRLFFWLGQIRDVFMVPFAFSIFLYLLALPAALILVYVIIARRFYVNMFADEGYLTLMLPVKRGSLILSKLIVSCTWLICCYIVMTGSFFIAFWTDEVYEAFAEIFVYAQMFIEEILGMVDLPLPYIIVIASLTTLVRIVSASLTFFAAVSIGQLFRKYRFWGSVLGYVIVLAARQMIMTVYSVSTSFVWKDIMGAVFDGKLINGMQSFNISVSVTISLFIELLFCVMLYITTNVIVKRHINLR